MRAPLCSTGEVRSRRPGIAVLALVFWIAALSAPLAIHGQPPVVSPLSRQFVVLKSGSVFIGTVELDRGRTIVRNASGAAIHLDLNEVELIADSIEEAASRLATRLPAGNVNARLEFLNWCLRNEALETARREIDGLARSGAPEETIRTLDRRWEAALERSRRAAEPPAPPPLASTGPAGTPHDGPVNSLPASDPNAVTNRELEDLVESLSRESRKGFVSDVHNRILIGCAAARCHDNETTAFRLWRDARGQGLTSTGPRRNLYAVLQYVDRDKPGSSPFLDYVSRAHGGQEEAAFPPDSDGWQLIRNWVLSTANTAPATAAGRTPASAAGAQSPAMLSPAIVQSPPDPVDLAPAGKENPVPAGDPYDPEIFNRQFSNQPGPPPAVNSRTAQSLQPLVPQGSAAPPAAPQQAPAIPSTRPLPPVEDDSAG